MNLEPIRALLADLPLKAVEGVEEFAQISTRPNLALPAAYVMADALSGAPATEGSYILHQVINASVAVVIVTRPDGARRGVAGERLHELTEAVIAALFGQQPQGWDSALTVADVRTVEVSPSLMARTVRMRGRTHLRTQLVAP